MPDLTGSVVNMVQYYGSILFWYIYGTYYHVLCIIERENYFQSIDTGFIKIGKSYRSLEPDTW